MAKHYVRREKFEPINDVQTLVRLGGITLNGDRANNNGNGQDACGHRQFIVRGPDKIFRRVILRHLTGTYELYGIASVRTRLYDSSLKYMGPHWEV